MPDAGKLSPQHLAIQELIAANFHKMCTADALRLIWKAAFADCLEWKHFRSSNRYLYLTLAWDTEKDEWAVQYYRAGDKSGIHFSRSVSSFFGRSIDGDLNECLRFTPVEEKTP
jgi:hypothetical protein